MNGWCILAHVSAVQGNTGPGTTWANEMNFIINHAPGAGSIARPVPSVLSLPHLNNTFGGSVRHFFHGYYSV